MREEFKKYGKRLLNLVLLIVILLTFAQIASAADNLENTDAFDAIGIDTSTPEGVDLNSTDNPYGTDRVNILPVYELFEGSVSLTDNKQNAKLYGHNSKMLVDQETFYGNQGVPEDSDTVLTPGGYYAYSAAAGDFTGSSQDDMLVTVAAGNWDTSSADGATAKGAHAGIYLYVTNPEEGKTSTVKTLLKTDHYIGNIGRYNEEDFGEAPYQLQNYLQVETGDFDGDGIDEIAVYVPQGGGGSATSNSRVEVYKLSYTSDENNTPDKNYLNMAKWEKAWTYYFYEGYYVSNMVSLLAGDFNRDGTDDIAMTWGVYYSSEYKNSSKAVILYGDKKNEMLQKDKWFDLSYGNSQIVRAAFAYGDVNGDDTDEVILGGQSEDDINNGLMDTRVINMYTYNGVQDSFIPYSSDNFSLVEYEDENGNIKPLGDGKYYSSPAMAANIAAVRFEGKGSDYYIYLDSVIYKYGNNGLEICDMLEDNQYGGLSTFYNDSRLSGISSSTDAQREMARYYVEYGALSGDFTGDSMENLHVSQYFLLQEFKTTWEQTVWEKVRKRYWWFWTRTWWKPITVTVTEDHIINGDFNVYAFNAVTNGDGTIGMNTRKLYDGSTKLDKYYCLVNTDNDTSFMKYTGNHYVVYTDPEVLAVIASAPYFEDVANMEGGDDHVGNSETSYSSTTGSEQGSTTSNTISAGAYFGIDAEVTVFGVQVASFEMETEYSHGWTWETEQSSTLEQTITYGTAAGEDAVAFYAIPMEVFDYTLYTPITDSNNQVTGYEEQTMTVNIPHTAAVSVLSLDKYESIAADYPELPRISGTVLTHEIGDPATYPTSANGYRDAEVYNGNWAAVGYGNGYISQEIAMGTGTTKSYSQTNSFSFKMGGGAGFVKAGVTVGTEWGRGSATTTTEGSTFSATIVNMPAGAEDFGYYYAWKLFTYNYSDGRTSFPVVNFLVTDVTTPPTVPTDFDWDTETTTDTSIDLTWSYSGNASAFAIYREYNFSGSTGMVKIAEVAASDSEDYNEETNSRIYRYTVDGLSAYQEYKFQIQVIGTSQPTTSAPGVVLETRTKTDQGYPDFALSTKDLLVYPDAVGTVTLDVSYNGIDGSIAYKAILYQWQKLINGQWTNVANTSDYTSATMRIRNAGMSTEGKYRCMVNVIYYDAERGDEYYTTAYSDTVNVSYSKRTSRVQDNLSAVYSGDVSKPTLSVTIENTHSDSAAAPTGTVTFFIEGIDYIKSYDAVLESVTGKTYSKATISSGIISALPDGIFEITAFYGGSRIFRSSESEPIMYKSGSNDGYWLELSEKAVYGDKITPTLYLVTGFGADAEKTTVLEDVYQVTYDVSGAPGWVGGSRITAKAVGSYSVIASVYDTEVASKQITVSPYKLTLVAPTYTHTANTDDVEHPSVSELRAYSTIDMKEINSLPNGDTLGDLGLYIRAINSAFKEGTILRYDPDSGVEPSGDPTYGELWFYSPGKYALIAAAGSGADPAKLSNYEISGLAGTYIITAATFPVVPTALLLNGQVRGTVEVISPGGFVYGTEYQNGTQVTFKATPYDGYEVKAWYIANSAEGLSSVQPYQMAGGNYTGAYLNYTMTSEPLYVAAEFRVAQKSITFEANNEAFGTVTCASSPYLSSGAIFSTGTPYTFTAAPKDGYHFVNWVVSGAVTYTDTKNEEIEITGGSTSITLRAVFERDKYVLTLSGDLQAYYYDDTDSNSNTPEEKVVVLTGAAIPGDKRIVVEPKSGYSVEKWTNVDCGQQTYSFIITEDTTIVASTYYNGYNVYLTTTQAGNGNSTVLVNKEISENITGGTEIIFEAKPAYGTRFAGWKIKINGSYEYLTSSTDALSLSANGRILTIKAIGQNYEIEAVFENNDAYTLTLSKAAYGAMTVTVTNPTYGTVGNPTYNYGNAEVNNTLTVYKGDVVNLSTTPVNGFRVMYWKEDAKTTQTNITTWTISSIQTDKSIVVDFSATGFYTVTYAAEGGGSFSSAKIDGVSFESGNQSMGAGTTISFVADPADGNMLDYWTVNGIKVLNDYGKPLVDMEYSFILSQNTNVKAIFSPIVRNTIALAGTNATMKVTVADPADYAVGSAEDGYTSVREGAYAEIVITPDSGYYINSAIVTGNNGNDAGFDKLTKDAYVANAQTGESWTGAIYAVTNNITVTVDAKPIHRVTFTPDNSTVTMELNNIQPNDILPNDDYKETVEYTTGTGTYYVRDGSRMNINIAPDSRHYIYSATVEDSDGGTYDLTKGAYVENALTGESWTGEYDVMENITITVEAKPIHEVTFTPGDSTVTMELNNIQPNDILPNDDYKEGVDFTTGTGIYYVRDGSKMDINITPDSRYYIYSATVEGSDGETYDLTEDAYVANAQTGENWAGIINAVKKDITVTVEAKPIYEITFTHDNSTVAMELSSIQPYNKRETVSYITYTTGTETYYVREGSKIDLSITPNNRYYVNSAAVTGNNGGEFTLTKGAYVANAETGESWTGEINDVKENITVTAEVKPIYEMTFTPDDSTVTIELSSIQPYNYTDKVSYTTGVGTYYVREGAKIDLSIIPNRGYALTDVTNGTSIIDDDDFDYDAYAVNAETGETWNYTIPSANTGAAFMVDSSPIHDITVTPSQSSVTMALSGPTAWYTESNIFIENVIRKVRDGANTTFTIVPKTYHSIMNVTVTGAAYNITKDTVVPTSRTGGKWTVTVNEVIADVTVTVETVYNGKPSSDGGSGGSVTPEIDNRITPDVNESEGKAVTAIGDAEAASIIKYIKEKNSSSMVVSVETGRNVSAVQTKLTVDTVSKIAEDTRADLVIESDVATITLPNDVLNEIAGQATGEDIIVSVEKMNNEKLTEEQAAIAGDNLVYDLALLSGGSRINSFGGKNVTVSIPYILKDDEDASSITVYYIADDGTPSKVENAVFDAERGVVEFKTDHFSYYMIAKDKLLTWVNPFADVSSVDWYYENVYYAYQNGLMNGTESDKFSPQTSTSRAMVVTILYRLEGEPEAAQAGFTDVAAGIYYNDAVSWATSSGIVTGYGELFGPNDSITREQLAAMLYRYGKYKGYDTSAVGDMSQFTDMGDASGWAFDAIKWVIGAKIMNGKDKGILDPGGNATRAEVAAMIERWVENITK